MKWTVAAVSKLSDGNVEFLLRHVSAQKVAVLTFDSRGSGYSVAFMAFTDEVRNAAMGSTTENHDVIAAVAMHFALKV